MFDLEVARTGLSLAEAQAAGLAAVATDVVSRSRAKYYPGGSPLHVRLVHAPDGRLLGGQLAGREGAAKRDRRAGHRAARRDDAWPIWPGSTSATRRRSRRCTTRVLAAAIKAVSRPGPWPAAQPPEEPMSLQPPPRQAGQPGRRGLPGRDGATGRARRRPVRPAADGPGPRAGPAGPARPAPGRVGAQHRRGHAGGRRGGPPVRGKLRRVRAGPGPGPGLPPGRRGRARSRWRRAAAPRSWPSCGRPRWGCRSCPSAGCAARTSSGCTRSTRRSPARSPGRPWSRCRALRPDVALLHAPAGDRYGNLHLEQPYVLDERFASASRLVVATVDELVSTEQVTAAGVTIPAHLVAAVAEVPFGAHPVLLLPAVRLRPRPPAGVRVRGPVRAGRTWRNTWPRTCRAERGELPGGGRRRPARPRWPPGPRSTAAWQELFS